MLTLVRDRRRGKGNERTEQRKDTREEENDGGEMRSGE